MLDILLPTKGSEAEGIPLFVKNMLAGVRKVLNHTHAKSRRSS